MRKIIKKLFRNKKSLATTNNELQKRLTTLEKYLQVQYYHGEKYAPHYRKIRGAVKA
jgi:hypothetical protein